MKIDLFQNLIKDLDQLAFDFKLNSTSIDGCYRACQFYKDDEYSVEYYQKRKLLFEQKEISILEQIKVVVSKLNEHVK